MIFLSYSYIQLLKNAFSPTITCIKYRNSKSVAFLFSLVMIQQFKVSLFQTGLRQVWLKSRLWESKWHDTKQFWSSLFIFFPFWIPDVYFFPDCLQSSRWIFFCLQGYFVSMMLAGKSHSEKWGTPWREDAGKTGLLTQCSSPGWRWALNFILENFLQS